MYEVYNMGTEKGYDKKEGLTEDNINRLKELREKPKTKLPGKIEAKFKKE